MQGGGDLCLYWEGWSTRQGVRPLMGKPKRAVHRHHWSSHAWSACMDQNRPVLVVYLVQVHVDQLQLLDLTPEASAQMKAHNPWRCRDLCWIVLLLDQQSRIYCNVNAGQLSFSCISFPDAKSQIVQHVCFTTQLQPLERGPPPPWNNWKNMEKQQCIKKNSKVETLDKYKRIKIVPKIS